MSVRKNLQIENWWLYLTGGIFLAVVCIIRIRLLGVPLERDEGEYAYIAQQLLQGAFPYTDSYSMKLPGIYIVYSFILLIFGQTHQGIHAALLISNLVSALLLFQIGRNLFDKKVGLTSSCAFLAMTLGPAVQGFWANAEHFVIPFALGGILFTLLALKNEKNSQILIGGMLLGFSFLIKQHGAFYCLFGLFYIGWFYFKQPSRNWKTVLEKVGLFALGGIFPLVLTIAFYIGIKRFEEFWFWTFKYASEYVSLTTISYGIGAFSSRFFKIIQSYPIFMMLSFFGLVSIIWDKSVRSKYTFLISFFVFTFLAITPGLYFRPHYFILWLPSICLFAGVGLGGIIDLISSNLYKKLTVFCVLIIALGMSLYLQKTFFSLSPPLAARFTYGPNPFQESLIVADYIRKNSNKDDIVAVLGSEPQILFYSKRKSATGYLYMYPLAEKHPFANSMKKMMVEEIESATPKYIVIANVRGTWVEYDRALENWGQNLVKEKYELEGLAHIKNSRKTIYKWGEKNSKRYLPFIKIFSKNYSYILVYKRK